MIPESKNLRLGLIGVGNYGSALLDGILLAASSGARLPIEHICLYDVDPTRIQRFAESESHLVSIRKTSREVLDSCSLHVIGVNSSQLPGLFIELGLNEPSPHFATEEFLFMDGCGQVADLAMKGRLRYGKIMFTPWVRYCQGIVGLWSGALHITTTGLLQDLLPHLGTFWNTDSPDFLQTIRATAGCSIGLVGTILTTIRGSFIDMGLSEGQATNAIQSLVRGMDAYLKNGGEIDRLASDVCSSENSLTRIMLNSDYTQALERDIKSAFQTLKAHLPHGKY